MYKPSLNKLQLHEYEFQLHATKGQVQLRLPGSFFLSWKTGKRSTQVAESVEPEGNIINFNMKLNLVCEVAFSELSQSYLEKRSFVSVYQNNETRTSQPKLVGVVPVDLAQSLNNHTFDNIKSYQIQRCLDKRSTLAFGIRTRFLKELGSEEIRDISRSIQEMVMTPELRSPRINLVPGCSSRATTSPLPEAYHQVQHCQSLSVYHPGPKFVIGHSREPSAYSSRQSQSQNTFAGNQGTVKGNQFAYLANSGQIQKKQTQASLNRKERQAYLDKLEQRITNHKHELKYNAFERQINRYKTQIESLKSQLESERTFRRNLESELENARIQCLNYKSKVQKEVDKITQTESSTTNINQDGQGNKILKEKIQFLQSSLNAVEKALANSLSQNDQYISNDRLLRNGLEAMEGVCNQLCQQIKQKNEGAFEDTVKSLQLTVRRLSSKTSQIDSQSSPRIESSEKRIINGGQSPAHHQRGCNDAVFCDQCQKYTLIQSYLEQKLAKTQKKLRQLDQMQVKNVLTKSKVATTMLSAAIKSQSKQLRETIEKLNAELAAKGQLIYKLQEATRVNTQLTIQLQNLKDRFKDTSKKLLQIEMMEADKGLIMIYLEEKVAKLQKKNQQLSAQLFRIQSEATSTCRTNRILNSKLQEQVSNEHIMRKLSERVITITLQNKSLSEKLKRNITYLEKTSRGCLAEQNEELYEKIDHLEDQVFQYKQKQEKLLKQIRNLKYEIQIKDEKYAKKLEDLKKEYSIEDISTKQSKKSQAPQNINEGGGQLIALIQSLGAESR